jgi:hypothetical protein
MQIIEGRVYDRLVRASQRLLRRGRHKLATAVARVALDLTQHGATEVLYVSPSGLSLGDRIKIRTRHHQIAKDTPGNVIGFAKGQLLALFFPPAQSQGVLTLIAEDEVSLLSKPTVAGPWALADEIHGPAAQGPGKPSETMPGGSNLPTPVTLPGPPAVAPAPQPPKHAAGVLHARRRRTS